MGVINTKVLFSHGIVVLSSYGMVVLFCYYIEVLFSQCMVVIFSHCIDFDLGEGKSMDTDSRFWNSTMCPV